MKKEWPISRDEFVSNWLTTPSRPLGSLPSKAPRDQLFSSPSSENSATSPTRYVVRAARVWGLNPSGYTACPSRPRMRTAPVLTFFWHRSYPWPTGSFSERAPPYRVVFLFYFRDPETKPETRATSNEELTWATFSGF